MKDKWELKLAPELNLAEELANIIFEYDVVYNDPADGQRTVGANKMLYADVVEAIRRRVQFVLINNNPYSAKDECALSYIAGFQAQLVADCQLLENELRLEKDIDDVS